MGFLDALGKANDFLKNTGLISTAGKIVGAVAPGNAGLAGNAVGNIAGSLGYGKKRGKKRGKGMKKMGGAKKGKKVNKAKF